MQKIISAKALNETIRSLEEKQASKGVVLKEELLFIIESVKPVNIIKSTLKEVSASPGLITQILSTTIGLAAGYVSNKVVAGSSGRPFRKLAGTILQFGITTLFVNNPKAVRLLGQTLMHRFQSRKETAS